MIFLIFFSYFVSHSWGIPMMNITGLSHLFKWENLHNWWLTKYFFAPLYIYTLTGHFIRYTCWYWVGPRFSFRTVLILRGIDSTRCWKHSSDVLLHIVMIASHSCCRFVGCTSMMWISRSTTSQRCSIGLRSGGCGGYLSKVNSLSCSRNQSEMIWALWHGALSCWKYIRRWYTHKSHKEMDVVRNNTQEDCGI